LLALTEGLFDNVPLEKMAEAEKALCLAAARIPSELRGRFLANEKLNEADRAAILKMSGEGLAPFRKDP